MVKRRRSTRVVFGAMTAALLVGSVVLAQPAAASASFDIDLDCRYNTVSNTLRPVVTLGRESPLSDGTDSRVSVTLQLLDGGVQILQLSAAPIDEGFLGAYPLPPFTSRTYTPLRTATSVPGGRGAAFGDGGAGGTIVADHDYVVRVRVFDFDLSEQQLFSFPCHTSAGPGAIESTPGLTTAYQLNGGDWGPRAALLAAIPGTRRTLNEVVAGAATNVTVGCDAGTDDVPEYLRAGAEHESFCFSGDDFTKDTWRPQGIAGSGESGWAGRPPGDVLLTTWYRKKGDEPGEGRVSVIDLAASPHRYRNVRLVEPIADSLCPDTCEPLLVDIADGAHVGGAAWAGRYLYVTDTSPRGLRVFDLTAFVEYEGELVLPEVAFHKSKGAAKAAFSFLSVDTTTSPPSLLSGEFVERATGADMVRWPLSTNGKLAKTAGAIRPTEGWTVSSTAMQSLQGVAFVGDSFLFTSSFSTDDPLLFRSGADAGEAVATPYIDGAEDLTFEPTSGRLWSVGEFAKRRVVLSLQASAIIG